MKTEKMIAFYGDKDLAKKYLDRILRHRRLEHLTQGIGFEKNGEVKGCAIGCLFEKYDHEEGAKEINCPPQLLYLHDAIFEGLPKAEADEWAVEFVHLIAGKDLSQVWPKFAVELLRFCLQFVQEEQWVDQKKAIERVINLFLSGRWAAGDAVAEMAAARAAASAGATGAVLAAGAARAAMAAAGATGAAGAILAVLAAGAAGASAYRFMRDTLTKILNESLEGE